MLGSQWSTFLIALLGAAIPVLPIAFGLVKTYLKVVENRLLIEQRPTTGKVEQLFHQKLAEAGLNGGSDDHTADDSARGSRAAPAD